MASKTLYIITYDKNPEGEFEDSNEVQHFIVFLLQTWNAEQIEWWNATTLTFYSYQPIDVWESIFVSWRYEFFYLIAPVKTSLPFLRPYSINFDRDKHDAFHEEYYPGVPLFH